MLFARRSKQALVGPARGKDGIGWPASDVADAKLIGGTPGHPASEMLQTEAATRLRGGEVLPSARWVVGKDAPAPALAHHLVPADSPGRPPCRPQAGVASHPCGMPGLCLTQFARALSLAKPGKQRHRRLRLSSQRGRWTFRPSSPHWFSIILPVHDGPDASR